ncbi:cob(I)yrinic acid a c-diamide adenosyltransferase, partial [Erythrobacter sp. HI0038]
VDGSRLPKHDVRMEAIGAVDEANSALGLAAAILGDNEHAQQLFRIQNDLFDLGADLATPATEDDDFAPSEMVLRMVAAQTEWLEQAIDAANANLEPLTSFVLPGGSEASARLHLARAATRRAERAMTAMAEQLRTNPQALAYINRLSDYLFVLARTANDGGRNDIKWVPGANR